MTLRDVKISIEAYCADWPHNKGGKGWEDGPRKSRVLHRDSLWISGRARGEEHEGVALKVEGC